ncbi:MAG: hypothetical protein FJ303_06430 [Planctomycetes bacterium]|nr:hypothetical protein [Planctomycetota bacterium]
MPLVRRLWVAAACVLALVFATSAAQAQNLNVLPADTEMTVTINVQQILKSEALKGEKASLIINLAKAKISEGLEDKGVAKWFKKAEFDLFKDLGSITFAVPGARNPEEAFILLEGNFDAEKIEAAALEASKEADGPGLKVIKLGGIKAFEISPKDEKVLYVGILNKKTMIACSTKDDFTQAVARASAKKADFKNDAFKSLVSTINSKQSFSMVATSNVLGKLADKAPEGAVNPQAKQALEILKQMDGFSTAVTVAKDIDFQVGVAAQNADNAGKYALLGNAGLLAIKAKVKDAADQDEKLMPAVDILNTIRIEAKGANLLVRGQITVETLEKLMKALPIPQ